MVGKCWFEPGQVGVELAEGENPCGQSGKTAEASEEEFPEQAPLFEDVDAWKLAREARAWASSSLVSVNSRVKLLRAANVESSNLENAANMAALADVEAFCKFIWAFCKFIWFCIRLDSADIARTVSCDNDAVNDAVMFDSAEMARIVSLDSALVARRVSFSMSSFVAMICWRFKNISTHYESEKLGVYSLE